MIQSSTIHKATERRAITWRARPECTHSLKDQRLKILVRESHEQSRKTYGSTQVLADLTEKGEHISRKRVIRMMQEEGLRARVRRRCKSTNMREHDQPVAPNILDHKFEAKRPNERWVGDTTELLIGEGGSKLYLAAIVDVFARFVVGWALSAVNDRHLVLRALDMAIKRRCPDAGLLPHLDQGSPYASEDHQKALEAEGIDCRMSRRGECYDNAAAER